VAAYETPTRDTAYAQVKKPRADGPRPRNRTASSAFVDTCGAAATSDPLQGRVSAVPVHIA
jgi:hypothetical protein